MALAKTISATLDGVTAFGVTVEAHIGPGLPRTDIVGLADAAITEARERIRTAVKNSDLPWPKTRIIVNLSPANVRKSGAQFDLALAMAILGARSATPLHETMFIGELGLDGELKACRGVLPMLRAAAEAGVKTVVIPRAHAREAELIDAPTVLVADTLREVYDWVTGCGGLQRVRPAEHCDPPRRSAIDLADIAGQKEAKHALEVAAAGGHHLFLVGPAGSGKSMLAAALPSILPPLNRQQQIDTTAAHSVSTHGCDDIITQPPLIAPHHSVSSAGLIGGGSGKVKPGAISLAHNGVLFLDEANAIAASVLDSLRLPLEHGKVVLNRSEKVVTLPARFQLVLAANPCACGADSDSSCTCSGAAQARYLSNITGPVRDRIDVIARTHRVGGLLSEAHPESSATVSQRVACVRALAARRWAEVNPAGCANALVPAPLLRRHYAAEDDAMAYVQAFLSAGEISQRGVDKALRVAWTLRDLDEVAHGAAPRPTLDHMARAIELRTEEGKLQR
ncbi:Competence protein ComM [Corynebacterium ciconiae DSM 44920]|uniref:YifB family Mg chelatase-like AAA ATPase n=1 Tax=Corynebacterium ciconiae TaxID=227319 RepID=UPI00036EBF5D|nr:YifB family Mg chelatase-like AAA ATPase [Corynebacterium ciconiae]WKD61478.1 Competence protein ComM [Corynebacterium ciconiae DSM 44920]